MTVRWWVSRRGPEPAPGLTWLQADPAEPATPHRILDDVTAPDAVVHADGGQRAAPLGELSVDDGELMSRVRVRATTALVDTLAEAAALTRCHARQQFEPRPRLHATGQQLVRCAGASWGNG
ncbi:hypothetical protein [Streptomyces griseus]|uniref:hypothetical protein n=1 Tax=Streptomyces griseus TaxID=1911 RepID=UPI00055A3CBB|nr:hypothetical protein [Streptomyces griseus]